MAQSLKLKIQLYCGNEIAMGPGKADLIDAIKLHGSIAAAARAMAMSYRRAWLLVDCMNRCWHEPLVQTSPGMARGGGARITAYGESILAHYRALQGKLASASAGRDFAVLSEETRAVPKPIRKKDFAR